MISSTTCWMRGRRPSTTRGVKARLTSARSRVWSGGSWKSMERGRRSYPTGLPYTDSRKPSNPARPKRWSRRTATQSS
jgi:hypothetical protein